MKITDEHLNALLCYFQVDSQSLKVDGLYGPKTAAAIEAYIHGNELLRPSKPAIQRAFESALADKGMAEVPLGSNSGEYIEDMRTELNLPQLGGGEWCGLFQSAHATRSGINAKSRTAKGFIRAVEALPGGSNVAIADVKPGFYGYALKRRGTVNHHIQIFHCYDEDLIMHVGGNEKHRVVSKTWTATEFFADCLQVVTYD